MLILQIVAISRLFIVTASDIGRRRAPLQSGQGISRMYPSICSLCLSVAASKWRLRRLGTTPSNVAWKSLDLPYLLV